MTLTDPFTKVVGIAPKEKSEVSLFSSWLERGEKARRRKHRIVERKNIKDFRPLKGKRRGESKEEYNRLQERNLQPSIYHDLIQKIKNSSQVLLICCRYFY